MTVAAVSRRMKNFIRVTFDSVRNVEYEVDSNENSYVRLIMLSHFSWVTFEGKDFSTEKIAHL